MKEEDLNVDWGECCLARLHPDLGSNVRMPSDQASFPPIGDLPGWRDCVFSCNFIPTSYFILNHIYSWVGWVLIWLWESLPQVAQVCFSAHSHMGESESSMGEPESSRFDPQRISIYSCMASIWKSPQPHFPELSICTWYMTLLHCLVMYSAVSDRLWLRLFSCHASQLDFEVVSILGFTDRGSCAIASHYGEELWFQMDLFFLNPGICYSHVL